MERLWPCFVTLAEAAPDLVTIDLVIAETLLHATGGAALDR